jgi:uncharacterized protein YbjT (DUF2867 family)
MDVVVAGGHGKVGRQLLGLVAQRGDRGRGLIRNPEHAGDLTAAGAEPVVIDLERADAQELAGAIGGADAAVFSAGAGAGSGPERKRTVDLGGAVKLIEACRIAGIRRYVMVSAMGVDLPGAASGPMKPYMDAKREADEAVRDSDVEYTIVRPGMLTDEPGTGEIEVGTPLEHRGSVTRADVAATLLAVLDEPRTAGITFDLLGGDMPIVQAIAGLVPEAGA